MFPTHASPLYPLVLLHLYTILWYLIMNSSLATLLQYNCSAVAEADYNITSRLQTISWHKGINEFHQMQPISVSSQHSALDRPAWNFGYSTILRKNTPKNPYKYHNYMNNLRTNYFQLEAQKFVPEHLWLYAGCYILSITSYVLVITLLNR